MTAGTVNILDGWDVDEPVPYRLSEAGWAATDHLPAEPLLRQIRLAGGAAAVGVRPQSAEEKALERAQIDGWVTWPMADHLAVRLLGLTPWELWGDDLWRAPGPPGTEEGLG